MIIDNYLLFFFFFPNSAVFVPKLLQNRLTDFYEILGADLLGLRIGEYIFFIPLSDEGDPPLFFLFYGRTTFGSSDSNNTHK